MPYTGEGLLARLGRIAMPASDAFSFRPVTMREWPDLQRLFGPGGADGGCWCMWWRQTRAEFQRSHGEANRRAMEKIIAGGEVPGLLAYSGMDPVGWVSVAPRDHFPVLDRSRTLRRVDDRPVWSIVCFYIARAWRGRGLTLRLIEAAVDYARSRGARIVEAYPIDPEHRAARVDEAFTGRIPTFVKAGFREAARRSAWRIVMRRSL
jgi:GNAT superfamily N-acetyltransferase